MMSRGRNKNSELYGMKSYVSMYDDNTKLDAAEAELIFSEWYNDKETHNYNEEQENKVAGKFNVRHRMFIITFSEF